MKFENNLTHELSFHEILKHIQITLKSLTCFQCYRDSWLSNDYHTWKYSQYQSILRYFCAVYLKELKSLKCNLCDLTLLNKRHLQNHAERVHCLHTWFLFKLLELIYSHSDERVRQHIWLTETFNRHIYLRNSTNYITLLLLLRESKNDFQLWFSVMNSVSRLLRSRHMFYHWCQSHSWCWLNHDEAVNIMRLS